MTWARLWLLLITTGAVEGCPDGWTLHGKMCYRGSENVVNGEQAKLACEDMQAVLASVHDQETAEFIDTFMVSYDVWIGLRPLPDGSGYQWLDGSETTYLPWAGGGEPDEGHGPTICVRLQGTNIRDRDCSITYSYICMKDPYSLVYAADTVYCTVPTILTPQHETLLNEAIATLTDLDISTCMQLFANGRNLFQVSADYRPSTTAPFGASFSGIGIQCDEFSTVYFEEIMNGNAISERRNVPSLNKPTSP